MSIAPTMTAQDFIQEIVLDILRKPLEREWSLQGLGMLRTYINPELRLHVWDPRFKFAEVSEMHTHPWNFHSIVIAGEVRNTRFVEVSDDDFLQNAGLVNRQQIFCGVGGGLCDEASSQVRLREQPSEIYTAGDAYSQLADEIHVSTPEAGTVTLVHREVVGDADHAFVFWPVGEEWVTAEPRPATTAEIEAICSNALVTWFPALSTGAPMPGGHEMDADGEVSRPQA